MNHWLLSLTIRKRLILAFSAMIALTIVVGGTGYYYINKVNDADNVLYESITLPLTDILVVNASYQRIRTNLRDMARANDPATIATKEAKISELTDTITQRMKHFETTIISDTVRNTFRKFQEVRKEYLVVRGQVLDLARQNQDSAAFALIDGQANKLEHEVMAQIDLLSILLGLWLEVVIVRSIVQPLQQGVALVQEMASGDLRRRLHQRGRGPVQARGSGRPKGRPRGQGIPEAHG